MLFSPITTSQSVYRALLLKVRDTSRASLDEGLFTSVVGPLEGFHRPPDPKGESPGVEVLSNLLTRGGGGKDHYGAVLGSCGISSRAAI